MSAPGTKRETVVVCAKERPANASPKRERVEKGILKYAVV
jgi:hypothetical protein